MHLDSRHRAEVMRILDDTLPAGIEIFAFGSRVHGRNLKRFSDLDLCLRSRERLPAALLSKLNTAFEDSALPIKVDLVDWEAISTEFRQAISSEMERLR